MCAHVGPRFTYKLSKQLDTHLRYRFSPVDHNEVVYIENRVEDHVENLVNERNRIHNFRDVYDCAHIIRTPH
ncbi:unnamed protein product [Clonostachys rhizophaga]|uniref:Uncharacterized protein n=1 Tax=Clonostachys rhizophaga TaxID=160324 RepID=A0A9N9VR86_9HYPO|nr:unnamed protein product [Clonostachys rhizophaga]